MARNLAIGDIHGCYNALRVLADKVRFQPDDVIVTLGDYVDRGPNSCAVLDYLLKLDRAHHLVPLRGNHDIMMLRAREDDAAYQDWITSGGNATLSSYSPFDDDSGSLADVPDEHWSFLEDRLVPAFETDTHFFVHANAYPEMSISDQPDFMLYWEKFDDPPLHESGKTMVCGHTSQKSGLPLVTENAICIDTWACGRGWLTCLDVNSGRIWQAAERGETRTLWVEELAAGRTE